MVPSDGVSFHVNHIEQTASDIFLKNIREKIKLVIINCLIFRTNLSIGRKLIMYWYGHEYSD